MKTAHLITGIALSLLLVSCSNLTRFPVSQVTPAATIDVRRQHDPNGNSVITIKAKNLASADRLSPPQKMYVAWIVIDNNVAKNIGQLKNKNAEEAELKALTAFKYTDIFITAENQADIEYPVGIEIARVRF